MTSRYLLEVRALGKLYPSRRGHGHEWVLKDLTFSVLEGEFLTIVGPSGAGKTTLLNVLAQIDAATVGEVCFDGEIIHGGAGASPTPGLNCRVGYVTQDDHLLPWQTMIENVLLPLRLQKRLTERTREQAHLLIDAVGLAGFERHYPHELSGGMRKRASLVRTLVYDPPVILMDEPFTSVDAETRMVLQADLLRLWELGRKTIVFVTHDISEAVVLGDRTLVLTQSPARVKAEYRNLLPRPRDVAGLGANPAAQRLCRAVSDDLQTSWPISSLA